MPPFQLFIALSGLAVTVVLSQDQLAFADPPPLPATGSFLFAGMHEQCYTHILWCDPPLVQNTYKSFSRLLYPC